ncbi:MAG: hypothetical protein HS104_35510 [Polyangiaceae bacterium]|nr:hypothetical protein [Polyangiaceae bacterium]MCL4755177.1 hypothetical protein [Myxococcales bacterium]
MKRAVALGAALSLLGLASGARAEPVTSISQYGVTWTFDKAYESGKFASGDHWVVGPVTVVSVSPAPTGTRHGSALNPMGGRQGYDSRGGAYDTTDAVSFPKTLAADSSLVSSVSKPEGIDPKNVGPLQSQAVLTVVGAALPATALRPAYAGTFKQHLDTQQIDWSLLPKLPAPSSKPNGAELLKMADRPRMDHLSSWEIQHSCAEDNWFNGAGAHACYGREVSTYVSDAALYVLLDTPERDELVVSMIQHGIDNYGVLKSGGNWAANGGHHSGRKWPIVFAARLLGDCDLLKVGLDYDDSHFGEDGQTYAGANGKALFGWDCGPNQTYFQNGCSGSGAKDCRDPAKLSDGCEDYRNCCTSGYWVGQMLSTLMLHSKKLWAHDPYFDYVDRWMSGDVQGGGSASSAFVGDMWKTYRNNLPTGSDAEPTCTPGTGGSGGSGTGAAGGAAGNSTGGGGVPGSGGSSTGGGAGKAPARDDDGGCGCRTSPARGALGAVLGLALLGLWSARRRKTAA